MDHSQDKYNTIKPSSILNIEHLKLNTKITDILKLTCTSVTVGCGKFSPPCHRPPPSAFTSTTSCCYRTFTLGLLWIPLSTAATQAARKIHWISAPLSSSVFWHIQMPGLKRVNNEDNVFSSRHSRKGPTRASEDAAGERHHAKSCVYSV